jgi:hypothetical protein
MKYQNFIFKSWGFDEASKMLSLNYSFDDQLDLTETYKFDFELKPNYDKNLFNKACQSLFLMAGVSYYKAYLPPTILLGSIQLGHEEAEFFSKTYQRGLGEFFYVNKLDPQTVINFPDSATANAPVESKLDPGLLIGIGGGKDSLVSVELLRNQPRVATWSVGHRSQLEPLINKIGLTHFWVERTWDRKLLELNQQDALNGHIPISAILACVGEVVAVLTNYSDVVVSNESSASEPNLEYQGAKINHQYSKSLEFEKDFQAYLSHTAGSAVKYYSFLRPISEVHIASLFAKVGFEKYKTVFSSCNRAFTHDSDHIFWCGKCPKCAFTFLALTPFIARQNLESLWGGKNLLLDPSLENTYKNLLGIEGDKPLDCVGEVKESRAAMRLAQNQYPELSKYKFEIPEDYDYKALSEHAMPAELYQILTSQL